MIIGLVNAGIVVQGPGNPPLGLTTDFTTLRMLTFAIGLALSSILVVRKMRGGLLIGIVATTVIAAIVNGIWGDNVNLGRGRARHRAGARLDRPRPTSVSWGTSRSGPSRRWASGDRAGLRGDAVGLLRHDGHAVALGDEAGLLDKDGKLPNRNRVLLVDSVAVAAGGAASASSNTTFIESAAGIGEGGRTGLASIVTGRCSCSARSSRRWPA